MKQIIEIISEFYNIPSKQIFADTRKISSIFYRHLFFYLAKETLPKVTYKQIIDFAFENNYQVKQTHATLINGIKKIRDRITYERQFKEDVENIKELIRLQNEPDIIVKYVNLLYLCGKNIAT